ncbi:MAG TPA: extracellular solute-binding protein [Chloroflexota bacterium]|nr:extracellular solute-binding protein [Chloroflexota bacterium]
MIDRIGRPGGVPGWSRRSRRALLGATVLGAAAVQAACGAGSSETSSGSAPPSAKPVKLVMQDWPGDFMDMAKNTAIPAFQAQNPHITVEYVAYVGDWVPKTLAEMIAGTAPDVLHVFSTTTREFADRNQLVNLTPLVKKDFKPADLNDFHKAQWDAMVLPGTDFRFALPKHLWMGFLIYDKDAFEEAGVKPPDNNWGREEYLNALVRLTKKGTGPNDRFGGYIPGTSYDRVYTHVLGDGGRMVDEKDKTKARFADPAALASFDWIRGRTWDQNVVIQRGQYDKEDSYTLFSQGRLAMIEEGTSFMFWLAENVKRRWDIAHLPKDSKSRVAHLSSNAYSVYTGVQQRGSADGAWTLMKFLAGPEYQKMMLQAKSRAIVPARKSVMPEYVKTVRSIDPRLANVRLEIVEEAIQMGYHHAVEPESFQNQAAAAEVMIPGLRKVFEEGAPVSTLQEVARQVEQSQVRR